METICIIAEKPSVAKELADIVGADKREHGFLTGNGYIVTWAIGHLVTLASPGVYGFDKFDSKDLPLTPEPFRLMVRQIRRDKGYADDPAAVKQLSIIKNCFDRSDNLIAATDAGREGELIFRYIYTYLNCNKPFKRLWISSLTDKAIREGLSALRPGNEFDSLYLAGKSRSEADWLVGINASRALSISAGKNGYSLGRVQTPTLSIICKRYLENKGFKSVPYWKLEAVIDREGIFWKAVSETEYARRDEALSAVNAILTDNIAQDGKGFLSVSKVERKAVRNEPPLLYDLTTLQKDANKKYGFSADTTLSLAQTLYEKKLTTYPRTGSRYISEDIFEGIPDLISFAGEISGYGAIARELLSTSLNRRCVDATKVTDHHALLVTGTTPDSLSGDEEKIYKMILSRMLEAFSEAARKEMLQIRLEASGIPFVLNVQTVTYKGWRNVLDEKDLQEEEGETADRLPDFVEGEKATIAELHETEHKTKPKPLFTDSTLLSAMENAGKDVEDSETRKAMSECGIGTPATRAGIIETLIIRGYIRRDKKNLIPTDKGLSVHEIVKDKQIANAEMTGRWEVALSEIEKGGQNAGDFSEGIRKYTAQICQELLALSIASPEASRLLDCPLCRHASVRIYPKIAKCTDESCGFRIFREVCGKTLSEKEIYALLTKGKTEIIKGLAGKSGKKFNAAITLKEDGTTTFDFAHKH